MRILFTTLLTLFLILTPQLSWGENGLYHGVPTTDLIPYVIEEENGKPTEIFFEIDPHPLNLHSIDPYQKLTEMFPSEEERTRSGFILDLKTKGDPITSMVTYSERAFDQKQLSIKGKYNEDSLFKLLRKKTGGNFKLSGGEFITETVQVKAFSPSPGRLTIIPYDFQTKERQYVEVPITSTPQATAKKEQIVFFLNSLKRESSLYLPLMDNCF